MVVMYGDIERIAFDYDGIVYGGYVRDEMISTYHSQNYYLSGNVKADFYNSKVHKSSIKRIIEPNDIDIYFKSQEIADSFIDDLQSYGDILTTKNNDFTYTGIYSLIKHKQIILISDKSSLTIDVSYPHKNTEKECEDIEPPFNNLDMLCNGFIKDVNGIRYSSTTGTYIDDLNEIEKKREIAKITFDIYEMKTELTGGLKIEEPYIVGRVMKMLNRRFSWYITNAPFAYIKKEIVCKCCNENYYGGFQVNLKTFAKDCFYEKLYSKMHMRELNIVIDGEHLSFT